MLLEYIIGALIVGWVINSDTVHSLATSQPKAWRSEQHQEMMHHCKEMCGGPAHVLKYEPSTGSCQCKG